MQLSREKAVQPKVTKNKNKEIPAINTILAILVGFIIGAILLAIVGINPFEAYAVLFGNVFGKPKYIAWSIVYATPLIFTGLSVAFAFRTGMFNIGAEGQYIIGSITAAVVGILFDLPPIIHIPFCILSAAIAAGIWGGIVGYLKAKKGVNEVLSMIMFNWIAYYLSNFIVNLQGIHRQGAESTETIKDSAKIGIPSLASILCPKVNVGIILAILAVIVIYYIINKTTLGYKLRAVGFNRNAAEYGGINVNRSIITAMAISGILAGLAGATQVLGVQYKVSQLAGQEGYGFEGITVALIGATHPVGVFFAGLFYGAMKYGGQKLTLVNAPTEVIDIIMGSIIFFIAIANLFKLIGKKLRKGGNNNE